MLGLENLALFVCWVAVVALAAAFVLSLAVKWGWLEWLQVHAPNDFVHALLTCKFCTSWWLSVLMCIGPAIAGPWWLILVPVCSTIITRELW